MSNSSSFIYSCGCDSTDELRQYFADALWSSYRQAVRYVMRPSVNDVSSDLWKIDHTNEKLLWKNISGASGAEPNVGLLRKRSVSSEAGSFYWDDVSVVPVIAMPKAMGLQLIDTAPQTDAGGAQTNNEISEEHVLMVTWTSSDVFSSFSGSQPLSVRSPLWVTAYPELRDFCSNLPIEKYTWTDLQDPAQTSPSNSLRTLRIMEYLGLPPVLPASRLHVVTVWAKPGDVVRPCVKADPTASSCEMSFVWNTSFGFRTNIKESAKDLTGSEENYDKFKHVQWFRNEIMYTNIYDYLSEDGNKIYPWTRLGYTFDYGSDQVYRDEMPFIGATEFVIKAGAEIYVEKVESIIEHCT
jgi:hypothetical protein